MFHVQFSLLTSSYSNGDAGTWWISSSAKRIRRLRNRRFVEFKPLNPMYSQPVMVNGGFAAAIADLVGRETSSCTFVSIVSVQPYNWFE